MDGKNVLLNETWSERRAQLVRQLGKFTSDQIQITESIKSDGKKMLKLARKQRWEGIIAKEVAFTYRPGMRSRSWLKLKIEFRQEFVVGGFTEPRNSKQHIGALLLGYFDHDRFIYVGHTGGGFTGAGLADISRRLKPLERKTSPFAEFPRTNEKAH
jgi:bifunctional non-homologous end joining protein LigD